MFYSARKASSFIAFFKIIQRLTVSASAIHIYIELTNTFLNIISRQGQEEGISNIF